MTFECQTIEWKDIWRDDYLRWICGFANSKGGLLVIGRNDQGEAVGISNGAKLLEDLPNKIRDLLGIIVEVNLVEQDGKELLEIKVDAYQNPISYRGHYYIRSGSTLQELKGAALDRFLLQRQGRTWDSVPLPGLKASDLSITALKKFRELAAANGRLNPADLSSSDTGLLEKLKLTEGTYLKRSAVLLFHEKPDWFIAGAFVKIGFFVSKYELAYHDEIHGPLFLQAAAVVDLLRTKYMKAVISYEGIQRIERFPVPYEALRESVLNALVHRDYAVHAPIQIRVYENKLKIWNPAILPDGWNLEKLLGTHASHPYNPDVANAFFRAGEIESWGRGIERIFSACRDSQVPLPNIHLDGYDLWMEFPFAENYLTALKGEINNKNSTIQETTQETTQETIQETTQETSVKTSVKILSFLEANPDMTLAQIAAEIDRTVRAVEMAAAKLVKEGRLRYVGSQKKGHWEVLP